MRVLERDVDASALRRVVLEEVWAWYEALFAWIPGRIGRFVRIAAYSPLMPRARAIGEHTNIRKPWALRTGRGFELGRGGELTCTGGLTIGDDVIFGPGVRIFTNNHGIVRNGQLMKHQPSEPAPVVIGDDVWVGAGATILAGVTIESGAVVAAGAVVTKDVRAGQVVAGVPARVVRDR